MSTTNGGRPSAGSALTAPALNGSQQRLIGLMTVLAGKELTGMTTAELAEATGKPQMAVRRDVLNLKAASWVDQIGDGWRLSPTFAALLRRVEQGLAQAARQIQETQRAYLGEGN